MYNKLFYAHKLVYSNASVITFCKVCANVILYYGGPKVSRQFQFHHGNFNFVHGNFNFTTAISTSFTAISTSSRQFQFHHGNFNFVHGNFNFVTAISISSRQFQLHSRQFQFRHGNFNFVTAISISSSLASLSLSLTSFSGSFWPFKMNDMAEKFEIQISKPKNNLPPAERKALKDLKNNTETNIKKADKGTSSVFMSLADKKTEGKIQLDNIEHYRPLDESMVEETSVRVEQLITELYREQHIDEMTKKWLCQTQNPPRIPVFYTLTKIHKPTPVGRPIISGVSGTTERLSAFVDELLQPIAQQQKSYLHSWTLWFIKATDSLPNQ